MNNAIYNPQSLPVESLPVIYGFNNGGSMGFMHAQLLAEDGTPLGSHLCSSEGFMPGDLGILEGTRADRHEHFQAHYPNGYRMEFVSYDDVRGHEKLMAAIKLAEEAAKANPDQRHPGDASVSVEYGDGTVIETVGNKTTVTKKEE